MAIHREGKMALTQAEKDRKRRDELKKSGGKNVLLRLPRQETKALDFLCRYYGLGKGETVAKIIMEESKRISTLLLSNPEELRKFIEKD